MGAPRRFAPLGRELFPLGLACSHGIDAAGVAAALDGPAQYIYWTPRQRRATPAVKAALARDRGRYVLATGPTTAWVGAPLRAWVDRVRRSLGVDQIDVLLLHWLGVASAWTGGTRDALHALKESGAVRAIGASIHDRPLAARLAAERALDTLMLRYNAAHPGAEADCFPALDPETQAVVAYTATAWGKLLRRPAGWAGRVPAPGDCYRFALGDPRVSVVLSAPASVAQWDENVAAVRAGPLHPDDAEWMRAFGKVVHG